MPPRGGLSDKIGNRYEGRIAVWQILQLLDERHAPVRVRFEEPGTDSFEWWVQQCGGSRLRMVMRRCQVLQKPRVRASGQRKPQQEDTEPSVGSWRAKVNLQDAGR